MTELRYVAAFRAWQWNDDIAILARRFFDACPGGRHVVLMNEARGPVEAGDYEKIVHDDDFSVLGLPDRPAGQSLWFNGDYSYIFLRISLPGFDHYVISESDVAVNLSLEPLIRHVTEWEVDAVVHRLAPADPQWCWYPQALAQPDPWSAALFFIVLSARALDALLVARQTLARRIEDREIELWPIVESFVPTTLHAADMRFAEIADFAHVEHMSDRPHLSLHDPWTSQPGSIAHPVLGTRNLARAVLAEHPPQDFHREGSVLHVALSGEPLDEIADLLLDAFARAADHVGHAAVLDRMRRFDMPVPRHADLALLRPAMISSTGPWSRVADGRLEAAGANGVVAHEDCGFHTDEEMDAWWMVDLGEECLVEEVRIVNRRQFAERFRHFAVEGSRDGVAWRIRFSKRDEEPVSSDMEEPWRMAFVDPFLARHVRIRRLGEPDALHLRRVQLFGRLLQPLPAP